MSTPKDPADSTAFMAQAPATSITARKPETSGPPDADMPKQGLSPATVARRLFRFDMVLLGLLLLLAFLLGSFAAHNTDVFLHLGLGSPFASNAEHSDWVHHAWLTSWLLSLLYQPLSPDAAAGGRLAVIAKALVVVVLAVVLCLIRRRGQSWLAPVACTALAVLVMSPRLMLQPLVVSLLFLGLTLAILTLPADRHPRALWWLPPLFLVWVNMDQWFFLGPLTVALWLFGALLQKRFFHPPAAADPAASPRLPQLAKVLVLGLAACLVNPWSYRAFRLPVDQAYMFKDVLPQGLVASGRMVAKVQEGDPQFVSLVSPFSSDYWSRFSIGLNAAGLAYFALLLLGALSFAVAAFRGGKAGSGRCRCHLPLLIVFVFFAVLSAVTYRMIPFFAVVAGPLAALHLQDGLAGRRNGPAALTKSEFKWAVGSRSAALAALVVLLICAWPGWLHGFADNWHSTHHVAWSVAEDPGVLQAGKTIREIHEQTGFCKLGFNWSVEAGNVFAWGGYCSEPTVTLFIDARYDLSANRAEAYGKIRQALREQVDTVFGPRPRNFQELAQISNKVDNARKVYQGLLRGQGIDYFVFTGLHWDPKEMKIADWLLQDPSRQWVLLYHDGRTAVFGWVDPANNQGHPYRQMRLDLTQLVTPAALPPNVPQVVLDPSRVAPRPSNLSGEWPRYLYGPARPPLSSFQSERFIGLYRLAVNQWSRDIIPMTAGLGVAGTAARGIVSPLKGPGPPGAPILAVRAARNATLECPDDINGYFSLSQAYQALIAQEHNWVRRSPPPRGLYKPDWRHQFRLIQIITALHNGSTCQPNNRQIHDSLYNFYFSLGYLDLALEHLRQAKKSLDAFKPADMEQAGKVKQDKENYDRIIKNLSDDLKRRTDAYNMRIGGQQDVLEKSLLALFDPDKRDEPGQAQNAQRGLVQQSLKLLLEAGIEGIKDDPTKLHHFASWQLYLLLTTGQAREANDRLKNQELRALLPGGEYEQLRAMATAALGDYPAADKFLEEAESARHLPPDAQILEQQTIPQVAGYLAARSGGGMFGGGGYLLFESLGQQPRERCDVAELRLMRGLLALELGDTNAAAKHFRACLQILPVGWDFPDRPLAERYLELLQASSTPAGLSGR